MKDKPVVFFGSTETPVLKREYAFAAKFDAIIDQLALKDAVKKKAVAIKAHLGYKSNFSAVHPFLLGRLVRAIKEAEGRPYIVDIPKQIQDAYLRGYAENVIGCPVLPAAGIGDKHYVEKEVNYKGVKGLRMGGNVKDADILIDISHVKGHNNSGFGGAMKNLALGCFTEESRHATHNTVYYDPYWSAEKSTDAKELVKACPYELIEYEKGELTVDFGLCNQCMRCIQADKDECLQIKRTNFESFFEIMAIATSLILSEVGKENCFYINVALDMTQYCDCWGFTTGNILPDLGLLGSRDLLAIEKATLDLSADKPIIRENVAKNWDLNDDPDLHPFARIHGPYKDPYLQVTYGEKYNLGNAQYEIEDALPSPKIERKTAPKFPKALKLYSIQYARDL